MYPFLAITRAGRRRSFPHPLPQRVATLVISTLMGVIPQLLSLTSLKAASSDRPNIILIMVDDMGFSDIGCYGGEIQTPNIDRLAAAGVRFDQFYNSGRCCPTRATLMTGLHPHQTGIGHMTLPPGNTPKDGPENYQGFLNKQCITIAEVLGSNGYTTLMSGKWHLGMHSQSVWPLQRGYDKFFGSLAGATRFFYPQHPRGMTSGNDPIDVPESTTDEAFYTTDAFTDHAIRFIDQHAKSQDSTKPFLLYLAYTAPHWPLQAFEDDIAKYRGKYRAGWKELRQTRYQRQIQLGLIDPHWELSKPSPGIPAWDSLDADKQDEMDLKMAVYAAMIDRIDQNIGKLVSNLKEQELLDNTLILFLSDNGACAEGAMLGRGNFRDVKERNKLASNSYGEAWANASSTPFRLYKHFAHEGGTATPFFMHWPAAIKKQSQWYRQPAQLIDVMPTLLDVAGAPYPKEFDGESIPPLDGISLRPAFTGEPLAREDSIFIEHENNAFVRSGKWKLVGRGVAGPNGTDQAKWELYDMAKDRTETNDLAEQLPQRKAKLAAKWDEWAQRVGVYPKPSKKKQTKKKTSRARTSQVLRDSRDNVIRFSSAKQPKAVTAASATLRLATYGYAAEGVNLILVLADDLGKTYVPSIPEGRSKFGSITKPLFADPNYNGSCDPEIIWNPAKQEWFIYYTARRATRATATYVGTPLGVITSPDLVNWTFRDYCSFDGKKGEPDNDDTHWAPGIILAGDRLHMYATYKGSAKPPWGGDGVIRHYVAPVDDPIDGWKLLEVPKFNQPDPIDVSFLQMAELKVDNGKLVCDRDADVVLRQKDGTAKNQPSGVSPRFPNNKRSRTDNRSLTSRG